MCLGEEGSLLKDYVLAEENLIFFLIVRWNELTLVNISERQNLGSI